MVGNLHSLIDRLSSLLELAGVAVILGGAVLATFVFVMNLIQSRDGARAYDHYRANLGRGILLGLELLVGADIIATITAPLTFESVGLLGLVVLIRTFLSFSLETEIEGVWPWRRRDAGGEPRRQPSA
ncbi:hypothetical protein BZG35_12550 [Brevundimonas sp. LM2]|uniref:DUF1622 domain-containing protein n=1 Tax=Brevundimonas sp. LM2 TaxID=1938605 RepID=UPI000983B8B1|nr:DUF1622 domain-containing protein [Brevundimonas sp. LM2]AQR62381.1 hypothetical protein BZG35_12550 [Brevundimonas sp. LM2]